MINQKNNILSVRLDNTDLTKEAWSFSRNTFDISLTPSNYLYLGYKKQIWQYYLEIDTPNTNTSELIVEKYNGSFWEAVDFFDETEGLARSGFLYLEKEHGGVAENENVEIRISTNNNTSAVKMVAINLVFCSYDDLVAEEPAIDRFIPRGFKSHILSQEAATTYIMRKINNSGTYKYKDMHVSILTKFDLFDINEIREAATFYTLHKIFGNRQDESDDVYREKAQLYYDKYESSFQIFQGSKLSLDLDDSGEESEEEETDSIQFGKFIR